MRFQVVKVDVTVVVANHFQRAARHSQCYNKYFCWGTNANKLEDRFIAFAEFSVDVSGWDLYLPLARSSRQKNENFQSI